MMWARALCWHVPAIVLLASGPALAEDSTNGGEQVPPPATKDLYPRAPTPDWDVGLLAGVCGVGQTSVWQGTEFCGGVLADVLWLRHTRGSIGVGAYLQTGTAGFYDFRATGGLSVLAPFGQLLSGGLRAGPLLHTMAETVLPGFSLSAELGVRARNHSGHYALTHTLVLGWDQSFGTGSRSGSALTIALRVDAFWLAAPFGMLL